MTVGGYDHTVVSMVTAGRPARRAVVLGRRRHRQEDAGGISNRRWLWSRTRVWWGARLAHRRDRRGERPRTIRTARGESRRAAAAGFSLDGGAPFHRRRRSRRAPSRCARARAISSRKRRSGCSRRSRPASRLRSSSGRRKTRSSCWPISTAHRSGEARVVLRAARRPVAGHVRTRRATVVVAFDVDRLSHVNDSFGRHVGDLLLQKVSERAEASDR